MNRNVLAALAATAWSIQVSAQNPLPTVDPLIGTWKQNTAQSTYSPEEDRPPKGWYAVRQYESGNDGSIVAITMNVDGQGLPSLRAISAANYDRKEYPQHTVATLATSLSSHIRPRVDRTIAYTRVDPYTVQIVQRQGGAIIAKSTRILSRDGRTMTDRSDYVNAAGRRVTDVLVFEKQ
jgi:hypothetical protein